MDDDSGELIEQEMPVNFGGSCANPQVADWCQIWSVRVN